MSNTQAKILKALDDGYSIRANLREGHPFPKCYTFRTGADGLRAPLYLTLSAWALLRKGEVEVLNGFLVRKA